jgi:hypothetical protein
MTSLIDPTVPSARLAIQGRWSQECGTTGRSQTDRMRRSTRAPDARAKAADLLQALAAVDCNFGVGGPGGVPAGLLRDLVIMTAGLAGRTSSRLGQLRRVRRAEDRVSAGGRRGGQVGFAGVLEWAALLGR